jgi:hypothetical protein
VVRWVDKVYKIRGQVWWRGLRLLGGRLIYAVVKGREFGLWRSVTLGIRAPGDSQARSIGRQMTRRPLWQRSLWIVLPRVVVVVKGKCREHGQVGGVA